MASFLERGAFSCSRSLTACHSEQHQFRTGAGSIRRVKEAVQCSIRHRGAFSRTQDIHRERISRQRQSGTTGQGSCRAADGASANGRLSRTSILHPYTPSRPSPWSSLSLPLASPLQPLSASYPAADSAAESAADMADDDWDDETFEMQRPLERPASSQGLSELDLNRWRQRPVEDKYRILVERAVSQDRMQELGVYHWSSWSSPGPCSYFWEWRANEQVFITQGTLTVTPYGCEQSAVFTAGDLVRFPKWLFAELEVSGSYEQHYRFRAYGDDN